MDGAKAGSRSLALGLLACAGMQGCADLLSTDADDEAVPLARLDAGLRPDAGRDGGLGPGDAGKLDAAAALPPVRDASLARSDAGGPSLPSGARDLSSCPAPPAGASIEARQAWIVVNEMRLAAGAGCMNMVTALNASALAHCNYYITNVQNPTCIADVHGEVMGCAGFTGADVVTREVAAGYPRTLAYTEVMTFYGNQPENAIGSWIGSVWHRIPLLDPWTTDMGYGGASGCDAIDIGHGQGSVLAGTAVVFPWDGQTGVPLSFAGDRETPMPPAPSSGWPSAYPISLYAAELNVTQHVLTKEGDGTPIAHVWLDAKSSAVDPGLKPYLANTAFLYGAPFAPLTMYRVQIAGTHATGSLSLSWTFTTGAGD